MMGFCYLGLQRKRIIFISFDLASVHKKKKLSQGILDNIFPAILMYQDNNSLKIHQLKVYHIKFRT